MPLTFKYPVARAATDAQLMRIAGVFRAQDAFRMTGGPHRFGHRTPQGVRESVSLLRRGEAFECRRLLLTCALPVSVHPFRYAGAETRPSTLYWHDYLHG